MPAFPNSLCHHSHTTYTTLPGYVSVPTARTHLMHSSTPYSTTPPFLLPPLPHDKCHRPHHTCAWQKLPHGLCHQKATSYATTHPRLITLPYRLPCNQIPPCILPQIFCQDSPTKLQHSPSHYTFYAATPPPFITTPRSNMPPLPQTLHYFTFPAPLVLFPTPLAKPLLFAKRPPL
jgi:hypothetical protein